MKVNHYENGNCVKNDKSVHYIRAVNGVLKPVKASECNNVHFVEACKNDVNKYAKSSNRGKLINFFNRIFKFTIVTSIVFY